jgi:hypothetical protein
MAAPTPDQMRSMIEQHVANWNAGDKEAWLTGLRAAVPGDFTMEDPVGTPVKRGWEVMGEAWDASPNAEWKLTIEKLFVCGNEVAALMRSDGVVQGAPTTVLGIEIVRFGEDGSAHWKTYFDIPEGSQYGEWTSQTGDPG